MFCKESILKRGFSVETADLVINSFGKATQTAYSSHWKKWTSFCQKNHSPLTNTSEKHLCDFILDLHKSNLNPGSIQAAKSAIVSTLQLADSTISNQNLIQRSIQGCKNLITSPAPWKAWDISILLNKMREDNDHSLKNISMKLATLLAISTGKRVSEICNIFLSNTKLDTDIVVRLPKTKNSEKNIPNHFLTIISYPEKALCPAATFYEYLDLTKDIRGKSDQLFIAYEGKRKGEPISKDRLSKLIRLYLEKANIFTNPHSIRSNMSSQCALSNIPIKTIIEGIQWRSEGTFFRHYFKTPAQVTLAKTVLDHHKEH